jgi:dihydrofolate synthase/folylpolyglutamate synthase
MPPASGAMLAKKNLRFNTLGEWLKWQEGLHFTAIELGLDRVRKVAEKMELLPPNFTVISIGGTNGKGSSATMLEAMLLEAGYRTGVYTSPHLLRYNERIRINGTGVDDATLCESFNRIDQARNNTSLTYFEFGTLAAIDIFEQAGVEIAIMEVGMGGRLDAVNMLDADVSLVCTVDLDHENWLGHDRDAIGREKAGIFRSMRPAICADAEPPASVIDTAELVGARFFLAGREFTSEVSQESWSWQSGLTRLDGLPKPGNHPHQIRNAAGVLTVLHTIRDRYPVDTAVIRKSLRNFRLPGRFQVFPGEIPCILDVAHNRQAAAILAENLKSLPATGRNLFVVGMLKDKNHRVLFDTLASLADEWYLASLSVDRGAHVDDIARALTAVAEGITPYKYDCINDALKRAQADALPGDRIIVTGSFITVGAALNWLKAGR